MEIFLILLLKLLPLYAIVLLGYISGRWLEVKKESIAPILIYVVAPVIVFSGVIATPINISIISLPILFFIVACGMCLLFYRISGLIWKGAEKNILAFTAGAGNTGYFGLPVALALFGQDQLGTAVFVILGIILYENSLGFFITARGQHTGREALMKVLKLPALYAFFLGLFANLSHLSISPVISDAMANFKGAYTVLGMMLVGLALSQITKLPFDGKFTATAFAAKFFVYPLVFIGIVLLDNNFLHLYDALTHKVILLMSIVPLASNTVAYATRLNTHPEKAAVAVFLSTLFALVYIPLFITLIFPLL